MTSLPPEKVIRSVAKQCSSEWYQLGIELGFSDNDIQAMTFNIPTLAGKLRAIVEKKAMALGKGKIVATLLDVCEQILPLATVTVMEELGIKYTGIALELLVRYPLWYAVACMCYDCSS